MKSKTSSRSTKSRTEMRKNVRRPNQKSTQMKQKELDSTCHRLSRPADKFASAKASMNSDSEFYSVTYFKKYPQLKDESKPEDKLQKLDEQLQDENLSSEDRFTALVKKKAVTTIFYGQESPEAIKAIADLGSFYKKEGKPSSAIRHYEKARELKRSVQIPENESMMIDIETAESYLSVEAQKESAITENTNKASKIINPYANTEIEDPKIAYRRDAILGRIAVRREKMNDAEKYYIDAKNHLDEANKGEKTVETGVIDFELAKVFSAENKHQTAGQLYQSAYDTFVELEMDDEAEIIRPFLPTGSEVDEEDERDETDEVDEADEADEDKDEENTETNILIETTNAIERTLLNPIDSKDKSMEKEKENESKIVKSESNKKTSLSSSSSSDEDSKKDGPQVTETMKEEQNDNITKNSSDDEHKDKTTNSSSDNQESTTKKIEPDSSPQNETLMSDNGDNFDDDSDEKGKESSNNDSNKKDSASSDGEKNNTSDEEKKDDSDFDDFEDSSKNESDKEEKSTDDEAKDSTQNGNSESDNKDSDIISEGNFDDDFNDDY